MNLNKETFICDENCFQIIAEFKNTIALKEYNNSRRTSDIVHAQDKLRPLIDKHVFPKLKTENGTPPKRSNPNYYAVFIIMLLNDKSSKEGIIETFKNLNNLVEKSGNNGLYYNSDGLIMQSIKLTKEDEGNSWNCCCGKNHMCVNTTIFEYNDFFLTVGDSCVLKEGINFKKNKTNALKLEREALNSPLFLNETGTIILNTNYFNFHDTLETLLTKNFARVKWLYDFNFIDNEEQKKIIKQHIDSLNK